MLSFSPELVKFRLMVLEEQHHWFCHKNQHARLGSGVAQAE